MELNGYQQRVINDIDSFLAQLETAPSPAEAWNAYWAERDFLVGDGDGKCVPAYHDDNIGAPKVCVKVPTGGGKTFIGTAAVKTICVRRRPVGPRFVVWLVPSDAILEQTIRNFKNPEHEYRKRLNADFGGRVEIFTKEELLSGQNFSPDTVNTNLCIAIFCYSSIRAKPSSKEDRKVYQENGNLQKFENYFKDRSLLIADTPDTALVQVMRRMRPIVVVDESHNVKSGLSIEMLRVLGPDFVLSMTATPNARTENVISYVGARELKDEHMVKLPVMVYNKANMHIVVQNALDLRAALERAAEKERANGNGRYIRPIVLFQAQPKTGDDSKTYQKIKEELVKIGIPEAEIKIKTGDNNELKDVDLMSENCPVRYIITVNALKEGWDCPFAYILASLANRSSEVDVEQVVGRVLRQPYAKECSEKLLNMSYVLASSDNFQGTVRNIVKGLNEAGFGEGDCHAEDGQGQVSSEDGTGESVQPTQGEVQQTEDAPSDEDDELIASIGSVTVPSAGGMENAGTSVADLTAPALAASDAYNRQIESAGPITAAAGVISRGCGMQEAYVESAKALEIPQFVVKEDGAFEGISEYKLLEREDLLSGFTLDGKGAHVNFNQAVVDAYIVDVATTGTKVAQANASQSVLEYIAKRMNEVDAEGRVALVAELAYGQLNKMDNLGATEIKDYIKRVLDGLPSDQRELASGNPYAFVGEVKRKIRELEDEHCKTTMAQMLANGEVMCRPYYRLPEKIYPSVSEASINKALYRAEPGDMNADEMLLANDFAGCDQVEWWHRIKERGEGEFRLNGKFEGAFNHYPDFIVKMKSGKVLLVESKGDDRDNSDSRAKLELGKLWESKAGESFKYFMVFSNAEFEGAMKRADFVSLLKTL